MTKVEKQNLEWARIVIRAHKIGIYVKPHTLFIAQKWMEYIK